MPVSALEELVEPLLHALDKDIRDIEATVSRLETLRGLLVSRDDEGLNQLLDEVQSQFETRTANERRRQEIRDALAHHLGCARAELTLSRLCRELPASLRESLKARQDRLRALVADLRREYGLTALLVADCARFNRSLMRAIFGLGDKGCTTYARSGMAQTPGDPELLSLHL
jgi:hypothetical protein